jgi:hypothetical protein
MQFENLPLQLGSTQNYPAVFYFYFAAMYMQFGITRENILLMF